MELEVGMYVRTKNGIGKIDETQIFMKQYFQFHLDSNKGSIHNVIYNTYWNKEEDIIGHPSYDIMDLIEVGDYVNGHLVTKISKDKFIWLEGYSIDGTWHYVDFINEFGDNIESIVTKEQFESMSYKVGD